MRVAILLDNSLTYDRRALLELETLTKLPIELTLFCDREEGKPETESLQGVTIIRLFTPDIHDIKKAGIKKQAADKIGAHNFDIFHCHDRSMLWVGKILKERNPNAILIYESRELFHQYPLNFSSESITIKIKSWLVRKYDIAMEKRNAASIDYLVTVNESLAGILKNHFRLKNKVTVTRSTGRLETFNERNNILRSKFNIPGKDKIVVYIGMHIYRRSLQMEKVMEQFGNQPGIALVIITANDKHCQWFKNFVSERKYTNIFFHPLIPMNEITAHLSGCDVGILTAWNKNDLSYWLALDNKLFSYIQAEIPILSSRQPEYQKIVEGFNVGVCVNPDEPNAFVNGLNKIISQYNSFLPNLQKAKTELCWEKEERPLLDLYATIISRAKS